MELLRSGKEPRQDRSSHAREKSTSQNLKTSNNSSIFLFLCCFSSGRRCYHSCSFFLFKGVNSSSGMNPVVWSLTLTVLVLRTNTSRPASVVNPKKKRTSKKVARDISLSSTYNLKHSWIALQKYRQFVLFSIMFFFSLLFRLLRQGLDLIQFYLLANATCTAAEQQVWFCSNTAPNIRKKNGNFIYSLSKTTHKNSEVYGLRWKVHA